MFSVEQLNLKIKQILEGQFGFFWVQGEISNFKAHTSGHFYFSLKDSKSQISAVMFRGHNSRLKFKPQDGLEVLVRGRLSVYEPRGSYQILCEAMEPVGAGALQKAFEQLKVKLRAEGLFDQERKRKLPEFPKHVVLVTSPTGAAVRDMMNILRRRAPHLQVTLVPTLVQGDGAAEKIIKAIEEAQRIPDVDVIIVGRGGGSIEDLWCFNSEALARTLAQARVPTISAVGHEIDFTIADFVADLRAPTPSAAAELVAQSADEILNKVLQFKRILFFYVREEIEKQKQHLKHLEKRLIDPKRRLQDLFLKHDDLMQRLSLALDRRLEVLGLKLGFLSQSLIHPKRVIEESTRELQELVHRLKIQIRQILLRKETSFNSQVMLLDSLSPLKVVGRGYSLVTKDSRLVTRSEHLCVGDKVAIQFSQGEVRAEVIEVKSK